MISPASLNNAPFATQRRNGLWLSGAMLLNSMAAARGMNIDLATLFQGLPARIIEGTGPNLVNALCTDSRRVSPGSLFFAMGGTRTDGNYFIEEAIHRGAAAVVSESAPGRIPTRVAYVQVDDIRKSVSEVAARFYQHPEREMTLMGVTGTNGKTTITTLVKHLMEREGEPVGLIGTVAYLLGRRSLPAGRTTPESTELYDMFAQMRDAGCRNAIMEVSSHGIDQQRVWKMPFRIAAFTNLTQDHIDYHKTMEAYFAVKARLFTGETGVPPQVAVINADDPAGRRLLGMLQQGTRAVTFGEAEDAEWRAGDLELRDSGTRFVLDCPLGRFTVHSPLLGRYNVSNVLCALAMACNSGLSIETALERLASFAGVPGRMEQIDVGQPFNVLVDYAHTPDALSNALAMLRPITRGRILVVFGCGGNRDRAKRPLMTRAVQDVADEAWATSDNPRGETIETIFNDMRAGVIHPERIHWVEDRRCAIHRAIAAAQAGDAVLIAGKGHETYQEFHDTVAPFDDRNTARELLRIRMGN